MILLFKQNVMDLSPYMTQRHPFIITGQGKLFKCPQSNGIFIFQYRELLGECKQVSSWTESDLPNSIYTFLLQVFLTFEAVMDMKLLHTHMNEWRHVLISKGAVLIDFFFLSQRELHEA